MSPRRRADDRVASQSGGARLGGFAAMALAGLALKWGLFNQLSAAAEHRPVVRTPAVMLLVAPGFAIFGALLVFFGDAAFIRRWIEVPGEDRLSPRVLWFVVVGMIPGAILHLWLLSTLGDLGYVQAP